MFFESCEIVDFYDCSGRCKLSKWRFGNVKGWSLVFVHRWALFAGSIYSEIVREEIGVVVIDCWSLLTGGRSGRLDCIFENKYNLSYAFINKPLKIHIQL